MLSYCSSGVLIDARGKRGPDGRGGSLASTVRTGSRSSFLGVSLGDGENGSNGADAGAAGDGGSGGNVSLSLFPVSYAADSATVQLRGNVLDGGFNQRDLFDTATLLPSQTISILADGGDGGNGGIGEDGEDGGSGASGFGATAYTPATSGGNGGNGGDGGHGTDGGSAGNGGKVVLQVHERDTGLLMLFGKISCEPGLAGREGRHGSPGRGGLGGPGGPGYSAAASTASATAFVSKPGGVSGRNGRDGRMSSRHLAPGRPGAPGALQIIVYDDLNQTRQYAGIYDLQIIDCKVRPFDDDDGVIEPEEKVVLYDIRVKNVGKMPTPSQSPVYVSLDRNEFVSILHSTDRDGLICPPGINPGDVVRVQGEILFEVVGRPVRDFGETASGRYPLQLDGRVVGVNRTFRNFSPAKPTVSLVVCDPVEFHADTVAEEMVCVCANEWTRLPIRIRNNSATNLGSGAAGSRRVALNIRHLAGRIPGGSMFLSESRNEPSSLDGAAALSGAFRHDVPFVGVGAEPTAVPLWVYLHETAPYIDSQIEIELLVQSLKDREGWRRLCSLRYVIRSTLRYAKTPDSSFLIVANKDTSYEEIATWIDTAAAVGQSADIWDIGQQRHLSLTRPDPATGSTLMDDWRDRFVVVLGNPFSENGAPTSAIDLIDRDEFIYAIDRARIRFYVYTQRGFDVFRLLYKSFPLDYHQKDRREHTYKTVSSSLAGAGFGSGCAFVLEKGCLQACSSLDSFVRKRCERVLSDLKSNRRSRAAFVYAPRGSGASVDAVRLLDISDTGSRYSWTLVDNVHQLESIRSEENIFHFILQLGFGTKLGVLVCQLDQWTRQFDVFAKCTVKLICYDLVYEAYYGGGRHDNFAALAGLADQLQEYPFKTCQLWSCFSECLLMYLGSLKYFRSPFYQQAEQTLASRFSKFINYEMRADVRPCIGEFVGRFSGKEARRVLAADAKLDAFQVVTRLISPVFARAECRRESELFSGAEQCLMDRQLFEAVRSKYR